jgi:hypothetical protein
MTLAEYARRLDKSRPTVTKWKQAGRIVMKGSRVDVEASDEKLRLYRTDGMPAITNPSPVVKRGRPAVLAAHSIDLTCTEPIELRTDEIQQALYVLDGKQQFDWSPAGERERARQAARCVGYVAAESPVRDDGHWGWFQVRDGESVVDGYGYELAPQGVLRVCREQAAGEEWEPDDKVTIIPALLPLLALPFRSCDVGHSERVGG